MLDIEFAQLSDTGRVREHNEDYIGYVQPDSAQQLQSHGWLFVLADGVGGHDRGEVASRAAVECITAGFRASAAGEQHTALLPRLIQAANAHVFETGLTMGGGASNMATTLVACALKYDRAVIAHVGDSRCYLVRGNHAVSLTRDHTVANEQLRLRVITTREAAESPARSILSRSLGQDMFVAVECCEHQLQINDVLVLCSDGLHNAVKPADIVQVMHSYEDVRRAAEELVHLAMERDGSDNISVQAIRIRSVERVGMYRGRPYKLR